MPLSRCPFAFGAAGTVPGRRTHRIDGDTRQEVWAIPIGGFRSAAALLAERVPTVVRFLVEKGARVDVWNQPNKRGWTPLKIAEGVQRGMNIVSSVPTAAMIREMLDEKTARKSAAR